MFDTATHCNALQHTATHCNSLHLTAPHCTSLQLTATHCIAREYADSLKETLFKHKRTCKQIQIQKRTHIDTYIDVNTHLEHTRIRTQILNIPRFYFESSLQHHLRLGIYGTRVCCSVLQCVAVCCSMLQCVAIWCSVLCGGAVYI